jgi:cytochrome c oxidase subunit 2
MSARGVQSALEPAGPGSALTHELGLVLYVTLGLVFVLVMAVAAYAALASPRRDSGRFWILGGGLILPIAVLTLLLVRSLAVTRALDGPVAADTIRIEVIGRQWWWDVRYTVPETSEVAVLANEVHVPVGRPVEILLTTSDVIHSFWVPALAGKVDMVPGRTNRLVIEAAAPGVFRGQCAEYCGVQHAWMAFQVVAEPERMFLAWLERQAAPARAPADPFLERGRRMFFRAGCQDCHAIRGTSADGDDGPDLTHVGSRLSLGAQMLQNNLGSMAGWIAGTQDLKPGSHMDSMNVYDGADLRAVAAYLSSLQ